MIKNEVLAGHITFVTTADPDEPTIPADSGPYNMTVVRQVLDDNTVAGAYIVSCGQCMAPPTDVDADITCTVTPLAGPLWVGANVTDLGVDAVTGDRNYLINLTEEVAGGLSIRVSDTAGAIVRFTVKRVNPRVS